MSAAAVPRATIAGPEATVISDSLTDAGRHLVLRVRAAPGTLALHLRVLQLSVRSATVDGRAVDTTRYRRPSDEWGLTYWAPPDSGLTLALTLAPDVAPAIGGAAPGAPSGSVAGTAPAIELMAQSAGIPEPQKTRIPPRPQYVVPAQTGDMTVVYRLVRL